MGYRPWDAKELDATEQLILSLATQSVSPISEVSNSIWIYCGGNATSIQL